MEHFKIAVYAGDGIGPEVIAEAVGILEAVTGRLELTSLPWGVSYWEKTGQVAPADFLEQLRPYDAVLLGALGWPAKVPDHISLGPIIQMRQRFDQYACVRPARLMPGVRCPLTGKRPPDVDFLVVRENSEGEYVSLGGRFKRGMPEETAIETALHTQLGVARILRFGFELARTRRRHLTMITKSNALPHGFMLWDDVFEDVRARYPDIQSDKQHVDAAAMNFVRRPEFFDVVVASNLFGDILTDLGGAIAGGLGLAPSANINPERKFPSMFEPVHGSAPDIAGQGIANPIAAVLSAALMLDSLDLRDAARRIRSAVEQTLGAGLGTPDLGGKLTCRQLGEAIRGRL